MHTTLSPSLPPSLPPSLQVVAFFSTQLEKSGPSPYSSAAVLETIIKASKSWPRNRLRVSDMQTKLSYPLSNP